MLGWRLLILFLALATGFGGNWLAPASAGAAHSIASCHEQTPNPSDTRHMPGDAIPAAHSCIGCGIAAQPFAMAAPTPNNRQQPVFLNASAPTGVRARPDTPPPRSFA